MTGGGRRRHLAAVGRSSALDRPRSASGRAIPAEAATAAATEIVRASALRATLGADNRLAPYVDPVVPMLLGARPEQLAAELRDLDGQHACQVLFGGFRALPRGTEIAVVEAAGADFAGRLIDEMALGPDLPPRAARLVAGLRTPTGIEALLRAGTLQATRVASLVRSDQLAALLAAVRANVIAGWLRRALAVASPAEATALLDVVRRVPPAVRHQLAAAGPMATMVEGELSRHVDPAWESTPPGELARWAETTPPEAVVGPLESMAGNLQRELLWQIDPRAAARILAVLAGRDPSRAGRLLGALVDLLLVRAPDGGVHRVLHRPRGAAVLGYLEPADRSVRDLLHHVDGGTLRGLLAISDPGARLRLGPMVEARGPETVTRSFPDVRATGVRRSRRIGPGVRWSRLTECVENEGRPRPLRVDLVEVDTSSVRLRASVAPGPDNPVSFARLYGMVGQVRRGGASPAESLFRCLGTIRLTDAVAARQALVGMNGGFHLDYGHYLDFLDLGIDLSARPELQFGRVIGWTVTGGNEVSPPIFNRAAVVVTADGRVHIQRVRPTHATLPDGRELRWSAAAETGESGVAHFDQLTGGTSPSAPDRVDVVVDGANVVAVREGGGSRIPLLGFVLSVPRADAGRLLGTLAVGDRVVVGHDLPAYLGPVEEAMACGPLLVRDGQVDLDLEAEGFGEKDSSVLPLSLSRTVSSLRTARSFVMLRSGRPVLGAVSGTLLGGGPPTVSAGMTFGELAQLCVDLGADHALAFDGGASSSIVARVEGEPRLLNVPTGGADAPIGVARFVKTYWLALEEEILP